MEKMIGKNPESGKTPCKFTDSYEICIHNPDCPDCGAKVVRVKRAREIHVHGVALGTLVRDRDAFYCLSCGHSSS